MFLGDGHATICTTWLFFCILPMMVQCKWIVVFNFIIGAYEGGQDSLVFRVWAAKMQQSWEAKTKFKYIKDCWFELLHAPWGNLKWTGKKYNFNGTMGNEYISNGHSSVRDMNHDAREVNFFIDPSKNPIERFDCELVCFERHRNGWRVLWK